MEGFEITCPDTGIVLTPPVESDIDQLTFVCQDPTIQHWTTVPSPYRREDAEHFVTQIVPGTWSGGGGIWGIRLALGKPIVGMIGLAPVVASPGRLEIGYWLSSEARGRGVMHRAIGLALDTAFDRFGAKAVGWAAESHDGNENWASWRAVWRHGFRKEGWLRAHLPNKGRLCDGPVATLVKGDPRTPAQPWDGPEMGATEVPASAPDLPDSRDPEALVRQFHQTYGLPITDHPDAKRDRIHMRLGLVVEETAELVGASYGQEAEQLMLAAFSKAIGADDGTRDTIEVADALGDLTYVVYGMALELGIPLADVLAEIQRSNMSKLGEDGKPIYREDGKVLKGPGFTPPNIAAALGVSDP